MRALLLAILLALFNPAYAQTVAKDNMRVPIVIPPPTYGCYEAVSGFQRKADSLLQYLDKSQIPTHILYDRVPGMANLDLFGESANNADTSGVNHFLQSYYEMHVADYSNLGDAPCRQLLRDNARYYLERGTVLIGALRYRFDYIDTNAVRNNQLS